MSLGPVFLLLLSPFYLVPLAPSLSALHAPLRDWALPCFFPRFSSLAAALLSGLHLALFRPLSLQRGECPPSVILRRTLDALDVLALSVFDAINCPASGGLLSLPSSCYCVSFGRVGLTGGPFCCIFRHPCLSIGSVFLYSLATGFFYGLSPHVFFPCLPVFALPVVCPCRRLAPSLYFLVLRVVFARFFTCFRLAVLFLLLWLRSHLARRPFTATYAAPRPPHLRPPFPLPLWSLSPTVFCVLRPPAARSTVLSVLASPPYGFRPCPPFPASGSPCFCFRSCAVSSWLLCPGLLRYRTPPTSSSPYVLRAHPGGWGLYYFL